MKGSYLFKAGMIFFMIGLVFGILAIMSIKVHAQPVDPLSLPQVGWQPTNKITVAWDEVSTNMGGQPIDPKYTVKYEVFLVNIIIDKEKASPVLLTPTPIGLTDFMITLDIEGFYICGVRSVKFFGDIRVGESDMTWSDNPERCKDREVFGIIYALPLSPPRNLQVN